MYKRSIDCKVMLHYDGKLCIGIKLGDVSCFTVFYRFFCLIKHVKIKIQNFELGQNEENIALRNFFVSARYVERSPAYVMLGKWVADGRTTLPASVQIHE